MAERKFTGRHAAMVFIGAFAIIIGVNIVLAYSAVKTFPGLEVKNSYVASQEFDDRREAQEALGWTVKARSTGGLLILSITDAQGKPVEVQTLDAVLGRPTHVQDDMTPDFKFDGTAYVAPVELSDGNWNIRMTALAPDGTEFTQRVVLIVGD
ncbi:FixH family protein [Shimia biformata]|uniref:FixH family protein n=1 Tax=Shimia biformata TaxID=1294299 RepID=UPI00194E144F|nr:FixH family protein [Shimia biformata]